MQINSIGSISSGTISGMGFTKSNSYEVGQEQEKLIEGDFNSMGGMAQESDDRGFTLYIPLPLVKIEDLTIKKIIGRGEFDTFSISIPKDVSDNNPFLSQMHYNPLNYTVESGTGLTRRIEVSKDAFDIEKVRFAFNNSVLTVRIPFWDYMIAQEVPVTVG